MTPSWLAPAGPAAAEIAGLSWWLFALGLLIYGAVCGLLAWAIWRRTGRGEEAGAASDLSPRGDARAERLIGMGAALTTLVLAVLLALGLTTFAAVLPSSSALTIEVVGHQWWWAVRYVGRTPEETVETANELRVPVGARVAIRLLSRDVIHSFWAPELQGKLDLVPGRVNVTWLRADRAGVYRGLCAEFCGVQHANMGFLVIAEPVDAFETWLRQERAPAAAPADDLGARGQRLFIDRGCAGCHAVRGSPASFGQGGPDLTHVASRRTLAAATLTNVGGHLAGWIADPQALKPGTRMPRVPLEPDEFHAVLHYLRSLR